MIKPTEVLVTGGAGFIGSHVVEGLFNKGYSVRIIDNLSAGKLTNICKSVKSGKVDFVKGDIRDMELVRKCVQDVDFVVHLAAIVSVPLSFENPSLTHETNVNGTLNLLNACLDAKVKKFIFASSCSVYGESSYLPVDEMHPTFPMSLYAESKLASEHYCKGFQEKHSLKTVVLRLFNVYGPRQSVNDYSGVITRFVENVKKDLPLTIYGDGSQTRDFVHVWDVVAAVSKALENDAAGGKVFNIGSGKPVSVNDLAKTVLKLAGADVGVIYEKARPGDIRYSFADISKAATWLGYKPKISLTDGLQNLLGDLAMGDIQ